MSQIPIHVEGPNGTAKETVTARTAERVDEIAGEMTHGEVVLSRAAWHDVDAALDRRNDVLVVEDPRDGSTFLAGRFDDDSRGDGDVTVTIVGLERDSKDAEPTGGNVVYQNVTDSAIVEDLLDQVPTLSAGTIETLAENLSMSFSNANPSKALRDVAEATGGELRYNGDDRTVDYVDRIGSDKPDVVLSSEAQTIVDDLSITEDAREEVTHVRGFGAQSGPDQVTVTAIAGSYEPGERPIWREYENKDVKEANRLQRIVDQQVAEYDGEPRQIEVATSTPADLGIDLGDRVTVAIPNESIDRMLRVLRGRSILGSAGALTELTLSNRLWSRDRGSQETRKTLQQFRRGHQGFIDRAQISSGWDTAGDGISQELIVVRWPDDIVDEQVVELMVQGRAWRSPVTVESHDHSVSIGSHTHSVTFSVPFHTHSVDTFSADARTGTTDGHTHSYDRASHTAGPSEAETDTETSSDGGATTTTTDAVTPLSPEVTTEFDGETFYPSDVVVEVNGIEVATVAGDDLDDWTETVDLRGHLEPGQNTITATPATRGEIGLHLASELFRRGRTEN